MGKKSKMLNEDPILKKNFKYEKRKKQRQEEKLQLQLQQQEQQKKMKELRAIQKKVQEDIDRIYQEEKLKLLAQTNKTKQINKYQQLMDGFKNKQHPIFAKNNGADSNKNSDEMFTKNLKEHSLLVIQNPYQHHFQSLIPKSTSQLFVKHKKITQIMKIEQQVKDQIKTMFSVKKVGQDDENNHKNPQENNNFGQTESSKLESALQEEQKQEEPFVVQKKGKAESQILVKGKILLASDLAIKNPNLSTTKTSQMTSTMHEDNQASEIIEYETAQKVVNGYIDYIHVENNEEQTIQQFRKIVVDHMYEHQRSCFNALKENKKSKGFTNAKYLIITPYVGDAKAIFDHIEEVFMIDQETPQTQQTQTPPEGKKKKRRNIDQWIVENKQKIQENQDDQDDFFRVGIKVLPKKKKIVYFSNFDASDIIVASPIGLKSIINGQGGKKEISFLSSVEILYIDRASVIMMQNWDHLIDIFQNLNYMPKYESLKNSINEIRPQFLELKGRLYRQNIVFTEFIFPELNSLKINHFNNWQGCITSKPIFKPLVIEQNNGIEKNFYKIQLKQPKDDLQSRFQFFKRKFWDKIHNSDYMNKIVLFVNSYFELVKLKGFLEKVNASFETISQHTRKQKIQSRVSRFNNGAYRILLLTQRAYYFGLCQIKKQKHIYFYSLPKNGFIFKDMIENIENDDQNKIVCIYSKYDKFIVDRLVGSVKAIEMVKEYCTNVSFIV